MYLPIMKWRSEYSHPLMLTRDRSEIATSGMAYPGGNTYVASIVDELKDFDDDAVHGKRNNNDQKLKEMVFAGSSK